MKNNLGGLFAKELSQEVFKMLIILLGWMVINLILVGRDLDNGQYSNVTAMFWVANGLLLIAVSVTMLLSTFFRARKQLLWLQSVISTLDGYYFIQSTNSEVLYISEDYTSQFELEDLQLLQDEKNWSANSIHYGGRTYNFCCKTQTATYLVEQRKIIGKGGKTEGHIVCFCEAPTFMDAYKLGKDHVLTLEQLRVHLELINSDITKGMRCMSDYTIRQANTINKLCMFFCETVAGEPSQVQEGLQKLSELVQHIKKEMPIQKDYTNQLRTALQDLEELQNYVDEIMVADKNSAAFS